MQATCVKPFPGRRDSETHVTDFKRGDFLEGDLARVALEEGWAVKGHVKVSDAESEPAPGAKAGKAGKGGKGGKGKPEPDPEEIEEELELEDEVEEDLDGEGK